MTTYNIDPEEQDLLESVERGEWKSVPNLAEEIKRYQAYAAATLASNKMISLNLPAEDFAEVQQQANAQGVTSESLIANLVHQFISGRLIVQSKELY